MNSSNLLMTPEATKRLMIRLQRLKVVARFDRPGEPAAASLVHSLTDLEKSFREVLNSLLPRILDDSLDAAETNDALLDLGEELRHIQYHIRDPKYFAYLADEESGDPPLP